MHFADPNFGPTDNKNTRNLFLGHFETPKEYGRHCHRYLGKVKYFWVIWITKRCQKRDFCSGGGLKAPPNTQLSPPRSVRVNLPWIQQDKKFIQPHQKGFMEESVKMKKKLFLLTFEECINHFYVEYLCLSSLSEDFRRSVSK